MKKISIILGIFLGSIVFVGCSKDEDCTCVTTYSENGVITSSSTTTRKLDDGVGPFGGGLDEDCDDGDYYNSDTYNGTTTINEVECELE